MNYGIRKSVQIMKSSQYRLKEKPKRKVVNIFPYNVLMCSEMLYIYIVHTNVAHYRLQGWGIYLGT